jgi:hypothetical protein
VRPVSAIILSCVTIAGLAVPGCGKKGPPLAPFVRVPAKVADLAARRQGDVVALTCTVPAANLDGTRPADIARLEVFAYTAMHEGDVRDMKNMTLVASIPVRRPPEPRDDAKAAPPPSPAEPGEDQGAAVTVTERLDASMLTPVAPDVKKALRVAPPEPRAWFDTPLAMPLAGPVPPPRAHRYYVVYGVSRHGGRSASAKRPAVPLAAPPPAPAQPRLDVSETGVVVNWLTPPGARLPFQEPADGTVLASTSRGLEPAPPAAYSVYRVAAPRAATSAGPAGRAAGKEPAPLTKTPLKALTWTDAPIEFGAERCYAVRMVMTEGEASIESDPSPVACVTPQDTFPPPAPTSLAAVAGEGAISLIWQGVEAADLAGYLVLRGEAPNGALTPVFETPLRETTYRDGSAKPGVRYVYAVVAVDRVTPGNRSALSNKVEETAR